jgi:hypothetical protein
MQFNPSGDYICELAQICKTKFEILLEQRMQADASGVAARKSSRSTQGVHRRLLADDANVVELRRQKRTKQDLSTAAGRTQTEERPDGSQRLPQVDTVRKASARGPGDDLVGRSLLVFCGLNVPGSDSEAVRWHQCHVLRHHRMDNTHDVYWVDYKHTSKRVSLAPGSDYGTFRDRGLIAKK